ncbi:2',5'-phosphodiesterase 12-like [Mizuhopecten yessoensis]|uniref:2',5'-phosphodiesterase 12 n=1 Tax=Mizuhopecten yessoensis TaxID=6573 RepID=A0A210QN62_MIZYE|nr:2',5'-phosphodiesterase 12-like [Mizuhopecten yessoensis]OWF50180.1 2',5'-phosphodiesterase 12 [Mizuhopecten yessoensis]
MQSTCHAVKRISRYFHFRIIPIGRSPKRMAHCNVRFLPDEERASISFQYGLQPKSLKKFNFERRLDETVGEFIERLKTGIEKKCLKRKKKSEAAENEPLIPAISISLNGIVFTKETIIRDSMVDGSILKIDDCRLPVIVNAPFIKTLSIPESTMAGFPVLPVIDGEFLDMNDTECVWGRFKLQPDVVLKADMRFSDCEEVGRTCVYNTTVDDVGWMLMLKCIPRRKDISGTEAFAVMKYPIAPGPGICPFEARHVFTDSVTDSNCIRVMSYNILADYYADTDYTRDILYSYCAPYALKGDYRKPLLLKEIYGYNCDIMCLQEVDRKGFKSYLLPALDSIGYTGMAKWKGTNAPEGEAIFFRKSKFSFEADHSILLSEQLKNNPAYADIGEKISIDKELTILIEGHGAVLQVVALRSIDDPSQVLCMANTHLYFRPDAGAVRLLQSILCIKHLEQVKATYKEQGVDLAIIFCGDFNSRPTNGVHQFVTQCHVPSDLSDWNTPGKPEEAHLTDMTFSHSQSLISACGYPKYTNYVGEFNEMLDYIFIDSNKFTVEKVVPPPDHDEVILHTALPSVVFPSDHIAQVCDIKWIKTDRPMEESQ